MSIRDKLNEAAGERRHEPRRTEDVGKGRSKPRHFVGVALARHPVMAAFAVATVVAIIPLLMVLDQQDTIRDQQGQIRGLYTQVQISRRTQTERFCHAINTNATAGNRTTDVFTSYIMSSVRASKGFERVYRQFGLPPYKKRLADARRLVTDLIKRKIPPLDCDAFVREIDHQLAVAGHLSPEAVRLEHYPDSHKLPTP